MIWDDYRIPQVSQDEIQITMIGASVKLQFIKGIEKIDEDNLDYPVFKYTVDENFQTIFAFVYTPVCMEVLYAIDGEKRWEQGMNESDVNQLNSDHIRTTFMLDGGILYAKNSIPYTGFSEQIIVENVANTIHEFYKLYLSKKEPDDEDVGISHIDVERLTEILDKQSSEEDEDPDPEDDYDQEYDPEVFMALNYMGYSDFEIMKMSNDLNYKIRKAMANMSIWEPSSKEIARFLKIIRDNDGDRFINVLMRKGYNVTERNEGALIRLVNDIRRGIAKAM